MIVMNRWARNLTTKQVYMLRSGFRSKSTCWLSVVYTDVCRIVTRPPGYDWILGETVARAWRLMLEK